MAARFSFRETAKCFAIGALCALLADALWKALVASVLFVFLVCWGDV